MRKVLVLEYCGKFPKCFKSPMSLFTVLSHCMPRIIDYPRVILQAEQQKRQKTMDKDNEISPFALPTFFFPPKTNIS